MAKDKRVKPEQPGGFKDYEPSLSRARLKMIDTIRRTYELYGFQSLETPCVEFADVLLGKGGETDKEVFHLVNPEEDKDLALRFDLTVPLARYVAANTDLLLPFKRYQVGDVFRGEKPQAGRFRQFLQVDADIVGAKVGLADAEIIAVTIAAMEALGIQNFVVRINNRKIHDGLAQKVGLKQAPLDSKDKLNRFLRILDKLEKIGRKELRNELKKKSSDPNEWQGISESQMQLVDRFLDIDGDNDEKLAQVEQLIQGDAAREGIAELREILRHLADLGVNPARVVVDLSVARGLDYYTGPVMETTLQDLPEIGSIASGGRYDEMIGRFHANPIAAVGTSIGLDRLFDALQKLNLVQEVEGEVEALIIVFDPALMPRYLEYLGQLRAAGIASEVYLGSDSGFKAQMRYGLRKGVKYLVICGEDEVAKGGVQIKDLNARRQEFVRQDEFVAYIKQKRMTASDRLE